ncbi:hypothetical protein PR048_030129 [Dryococelus australis]|uniref:Uncharacterized protein n=1 Tax=Dryococelus australis TaxID=614101 RepID=A0ABQ9GBZ1_9NEOP|nr:hypothetical protein PR048_030129 [Dryococelus australis]
MLASEGCVIKSREFGGEGRLQRFARTLPTRANWVQSPAGSLPGFRLWESCRTMPLVGGFPRGSPVSPALSFWCCSILTLITLIGSQDLANGTAPECKGGGKRENPEKTRRPAASSGTISTWEGPGATQSGIEPGSAIWEASSLTATPPKPLPATVSLLASHQDETGSIPGRVTPDFACGNRAGRCRWSAGFSRGSPFSPAFSFRRCSVVTSITLIGSQDLAVKVNLPHFSSRHSSKSHCDMQRRCASSLVYALNKTSPFRTHLHGFLHVHDNHVPRSREEAAVAERLACSPPTKVNRAQSPCRTMPLVDGFSRGYPVSPPFYSGAAPYCYKVLGTKEPESNCLAHLTLSSEPVAQDVGSRRTAQPAPGVLHFGRRHDGERRRLPHCNVRYSRRVLQSALLPGLNRKLTLLVTAQLPRALCHSTYSLCGHIAGSPRHTPRLLGAPQPAARPAGAPRNPQYTQRGCQVGGRSSGSRVDASRVPLSARTITTPTPQVQEAGPTGPPPPFSLTSSHRAALEVAAGARLQKAATQVDEPQRTLHDYRLPDTGLEELCPYRHNRTLARLGDSFDTGTVHSPAHRPCSLYFITMQCKDEELASGMYEQLGEFEWREEIWAVLNVVVLRADEV